MSLLGFRSSTFMVRFLFLFFEFRFLFVNKIKNRILKIIEIISDFDIFTI